MMTRIADERGDGLRRPTEAGRAAGAKAGVRCPVCESVDVSDRGAPRYRQPARVAGVPVEISDLTLRHYRCRGCGYQFVFPRIPPERLLACYRGSADHWATGTNVAEDRYYARKREMLERHAPGRRVLDLGCYDGGFLEHLGEDWQRFGVEPSAAAAGRARDRGVDVIAPTVEAVPWDRYQGTMDAVVCFDVLEHLPDPVATLRAVARLLRPGGVLVAETGDAGAWLWRLVGRSFWYCGIPEHIGFFDRRSLCAAGGRAGLELIEFVRTRHARVRVSGYVHAAAVFGPYFLLRGLSAMRIPLSARLGNVAAGPLPGSWVFRDHFLAALRKGAPPDVTPDYPSPDPTGLRQ